MRYKFVPTTTITAETVTVDGFTRSQKDTAGITTTATRAYTASGMVITQTDGRGNTTTTVTDIAGRTTSVTDAAGNVTTTAYDTAHDQPSVITDAQGNTSCYRYDARGNVKTHAYESARGLLLGTTYSVVEGTAATTARSYAYNHLGQLTQVVDDAGTRTIGYNAYGEQESDSLNAGTHTHLMQTLSMPNNMTLTQSYASQRDLLTGMSYKRGNTPVAERIYSYAYDNIANRTTATEVGIITAYASNNLNQYTAVGEFTPTFDADGNQTLVKTATGIRSVEYNAETRPVRFTNQQKLKRVCTLVPFLED